MGAADSTRRTATALRRLALAAAVAAALGPAASADALTILGSYVGQSVPPPPSRLFGGGNLDDVFAAAADLWEAAILDDVTVEISYGWSSLGRDTLGMNVGSFVWLSNSHGWIMDPTPWRDEEWSTYHEASEDLGGAGGPVNTARVLSGYLGGGDWDAFSVLLHEIGHALGWNLAPHVMEETRDGHIDLTAPRPFAGAALPVYDSLHLSLQHALMYPFFTDRERKLLSEADILALAQLNGWEKLDLSPHRSVPESTGLLGGAVAAAVLAVARGVGSRRAICRTSGAAPGLASRA